MYSTSWVKLECTRRVLESQDACTQAHVAALLHRNLSSSEKRTFKDKLQSAIQQAEEAELAAMREAATQDRKSLAIAMLVEGRPQAFVDFFHLTHATPVSALAPGGQQGEGEASGQDLPHESLLLLKNQLVRADAARQAGNVEEVYSAYKHLAKYFAQLGRLKTAEFFFKQCLYISRDAAWLPGELEANLALGVVYEELHDTAAAIACHERRLDLATENNLQVGAWLEMSGGARCRGTDLLAMCSSRLVAAHQTQLCLLGN